MLQFKLVEEIIAKGYNKPYVFMKKFFNFSSNKASFYMKGKQTTISLHELSRICTTFKCTPNDIFYWQQSATAPLPSTHPLLILLSAPKQITDLATATQALDDEGRKKMYALMQELLDEKAGKKNAKKDDSLD